MLSAMSTQTIAIHLPDGSIREVSAGTTPLEIANSISPRLAAASVVARLTPVTAGKSEGAEDPAERPSDSLVDLSLGLQDRMGNAG